MAVGLIFSSPLRAAPSTHALAALRHWSRSRDVQTERFWQLTGWAAAGVAGY